MQFVIYFQQRERLFMKTMRHNSAVTQGKYLQDEKQRGCWETSSFFLTPTLKFIKSVRQTNWIISASGRIKKRRVWRIWSRFRGNNPSPRLWWRCSVGGALTGSAGVHLFFLFYIRTPTTVCALQGKSFSLCNTTNRQQGYFQ